MAQRYRSLYVFGDSFSDMGARYVDGDGPTAVAYLAQLMGIDMTYPKDPNAAGKSLNFAASGAITGLEPELDVGVLNWCKQGMLNQVAEFAGLVRDGRVAFSPESTLFFIAGGLNDAGLSTETTIRNLSEQLGILRGVGASQFTLALLPTKIPMFAEVGKRLNPAYADFAETLQQQNAFSLRLCQWGLYFDDILENARLYGFTNVSSPCAGRALLNEDPTPRGDPSHFFYYHEGHPSTAVHRIVGTRLYRELTS